MYVKFSVCEREYVCACMYVRMCTYLCVGRSVFMCVCQSIYMYLSVCVCYFSGYESLQLHYSQPCKHVHILMYQQNNIGISRPSNMG